METFKSYFRFTVNIFIVFNSSDTGFQVDYLKGKSLLRWLKNDWAAVDYELVKRQEEELTCRIPCIYYIQITRVRIDR